MSRTCSQCGNNGHNSRTCSDAAAGAGNAIMLFGVRLTEGSIGGGGGFRKSASMTNLSHYDLDHHAADHPHESSAAVEAGYASDDVVHASGRSHERKRGIPWTEEEHRMFLVGLQRVGKGDWRGISRNFVKTRTPTQVASHAQKYFLRRINHNRRRRRSSLFDITTDTFTNALMEEDATLVNNAEASQSQPLDHNLSMFPAQAFPMAIPPVALPVVSENPEEESTGLSLDCAGPSRSPASKIVRPIPLHPMIPPSSKMASLNLDSNSPRNNNIAPEQPGLPLSLKLSTPSSSPSNPSAFQAMPNGDSVITCA